MKYFANTVGGLSLIQLQYFVVFPALIISCLLLFGVYHWASIVTNKDLLQKLIMLLLGYGALQFIMTVYCVITFFLSFGGIDWEVGKRKCFASSRTLIMLLITLFSRSVS